MRTCIALLLFFFLPRPSFAWGPDGHRIIADTARTRLSSPARAQIVKLLGNDNLAAISVWADEIKSERPETASWHFVDIPIRAPAFSEARDCYHPDSKSPPTLQDHHNCVVDRITMFEAVLADSKAPHQKRVEALKFVVHLVGDIHQPLHAIGEARGGNEIHVVEFGSPQCGARPCNLHYTWDIGLIEHTRLRESEYVSRIQQKIASQKFNSTWLGAPAGWANESFRIAKNVWVSEGGAVDEQYYKANIDLVDQRLEMAGMRLAALLNRALAK